MVTQLSPDVVQEGKLLLENLDKRGVAVNSAFWMNEPAGSWKLLLGMPDADRHGPRKGYKLVQAALKRLSSPTLTLDDVGLLKPNAPVVDLLGTMIRTDRRALGSISFTGSSINGTLIPDSLIYRLYRPGKS